MDVEDIMDKEIRELMQEPTDIDYLIETKTCAACIEHDKRAFEYPCHLCFTDNRLHPYFREDMRDNIIDRVTDQNQGV